MATDLTADTAGLKSAAADSLSVVGDLLVNRFDGPLRPRPSGAGIAAVEAASAAARMRTADRMVGQAGDVAAAGDRYETTDGGSGDAIAVTV
ncbi:hypothetical protein ACAG25_18100 [Mycobacterium sp. pV006]|uniref:hypothetical protein n=1 Tax=Mycobacterium sp. pV006 TaxID=3238983 RepID=UPI00351AF212